MAIITRSCRTLGNAIMNLDEDPNEWSVENKLEERESSLIS